NISPTPNPNSFLVALASAFGVSSSSVGDELELYNELSSYAATVSGGDREGDDETSPKVFATILLFDRNYNLVDAGWDQISATANQGSSTSKTFCAHDLITKEVTVKEPGYAYVFISNEHPTFVETYFDDLTITHTQSPIVAGSDYYPFGLVMDDRTITDEAYRYGYQGQYSEKNDSTGWNEFQLRMYDARFGRWLSVDPYGQFWSPYVGMGNIPHMGTDPDGGLCCGGGGAAIEIGM